MNAYTQKHSSSRQPVAHNNWHGSKLWRIVTAAVLGLILFFGLNPRGSHITNNVAWLSDGPGLRFEKYGIAYTDPAFPAAPSAALSLEMAIKPLSAGMDGFSLILAFHNGDDETQLILGQWRNWLIVMNGDDYAHRRNLKRLSTSIEGIAGKKAFVTITSGSSGARMYIDGEPVALRRDTTFTIPDGDAGTRLIVANSVYGKHSWNGEIYGLAVYHRTLSPTMVKNRYDRWQASHDLSTGPRPVAQYTMTEGKGDRVIDRTGAADLQLPARMSVLKKRFLSIPVAAAEGNSGLIQDLLLNLVGFIPLGFALCRAVPLVAGNCGFRAVGAVVATGFLVSLLIETLQVWLPSRNSSATDLLMNTLGTYVGTAIALWTSPRPHPSADVCK